jgi:hypothetical protein
MKRLKAWLYQRFLPAYCRDELMEENARLLKANAEQRAEIDRLNAYIQGMETALRSRQRVIIRNEVTRA